MLPLPANQNPSSGSRLSFSSLTNSLSSKKSKPSLESSRDHASRSDDDDPHRKKQHQSGPYILLHKLSLLLPPSIRNAVIQHSGYLQPIGLLLALVLIYLLVLATSTSSDASPYRSSGSNSQKVRSRNPLIAAAKRRVLPAGWRFGLPGVGGKDPILHEPLRWQPLHSVVNWGDHVGLGRARQGVLEHTPKTYNDITDRVDVKGLSDEPWYRIRKSDLPIGSVKAWTKLMKDREGLSAGELEKKSEGSLGNERRGVMGGASVEWSTGIVGSGVWLGQGADMKKFATSPEALLAQMKKEAQLKNLNRLSGRDGDDYEEEEDDIEVDESAMLDEVAAMTAEADKLAEEEANLTEEEREEAEDIREVMELMKPKSPRQALEKFIIEKAWEYIDEEDELNTQKIMEDAKKRGSVAHLPLRDQVRDDEGKRQEAAEGWSRIYAITDGERAKSALEVQLEKLVRRVPIVVFSQSDCTPCKWAIGYLKELKLSPELYVVMVDQRPDQKNLGALLFRRTDHQGYPNIIVGGRSIGGSSELEYLAEQKQLAALLDDAGVQHNLERRKGRKKKKKSKKVVDDGAN
ncbi:BQ2448_5888 [Microbotryum intermedium]|uniref:BQ2448_5888 protein n=1 Tax=Microbotryum intermedium TaxID=269621 RepID=A0A238EZG2_9BASI|nr:BQ2448_5888 [Microbotryum intermedium]